MTADTAGSRRTMTDGLAVVRVLIDLILSPMATGALDRTQFFFMRDSLDVTMTGGALFISMDGSLELDRIDCVVTGETILVRDPLQGHHRDRAEEDHEDRQQKNRMNLFHKIVLCSMREVALQNGRSLNDFFIRHLRYDTRYTAFPSTFLPRQDPDA